MAKIIGGTVTTPVRQSDWKQTDPKKIDYIKNKPTIPNPVTVDDALSATSTNPVQNKVVNAKFAEMTEWHNAMADIVNEHTNEITTLQNGASQGGSITVDSEFSDTSENPVQNKVITAAMGEALGVLGELQSGLSQGEQAILFLNGEVTNLETQMGDIETALDNIIAMQNSYIGGDA